jgi:hypothetical protein
MISFLKRRVYERDVLRRIENDLMEIHGRELGGECLGMFATTILKAQELDGFPKDYANQLRERGVSEPDAALAMLDASITALKRMTSGVDLGDEITRVVEAMEGAVDKIFARNQGMIVPRNGKFGPMMDGFAKDLV